MRWYILFMFSLTLTVTATAQERKPAKEQSAPEGSTVSEQGKQEPEPARFVDEDGDGVNDNARKNTDPRSGRGEQTRMRERHRDQFIDADGDGINDSRCSGMGIEQGGQRRGGRK